MCPYLVTGWWRFLIKLPGVGANNALRQIGNPRLLDQKGPFLRVAVGVLLVLPTGFLRIVVYMAQMGKNGPFLPKFLGPFLPTARDAKNEF